MLFSRQNRLTTALANVRETIFEHREESLDLSAPMEILTGHKHPLARHGITGLDGLAVRTLTREETDKWENIPNDGFILVPADGTPAAGSDEATTVDDAPALDGDPATEDRPDGIEGEMHSDEQDAWNDGSEEFGDPDLTGMDGSGYESAYPDERDYHH